MKYLEEKIKTAQERQKELQLLIESWKQQLENKS
jgi:hypothetical protein|tara:strand:- start:203 stop:304 length:102 start_codon:yes stop_codon:yes gene_type:complete